MLTADDAEAQAALNVVLEDNMYLGQVIFYSLDRLFLQYGHAVSDAAVVVMPASSVVDGEVRAPASPGGLDCTRVVLPEEALAGALAQKLTPQNCYTHVVSPCSH